MGDVNNTRAPLTQAANHSKESRGFSLRKRGGRLVQNQHSCFNRKRLCDLNHLLFRWGKIFDWGFRTEIDVQFSKDLLCASMHLPAIDHPQGPDRLASKENILGHAERRSQAA